MAKIRLQITKGETVRYISHLDYSRTIERALRRAKLPVAYSEGFNPHMKMSLASALALGVTSDAEYMDLELSREMPLEAFKTALSGQLPRGIELKEAKYLAPQTPALMKVVNLGSYMIKAPLTSSDNDRAAAAVDEFNAAQSVLYIKESPKGKKEIDIKKLIASNLDLVSWDGISAQLTMAIHITPTGSVKPGEVLSVLVSQFGLPVDKEAAVIHRTGLFINDGRKWHLPTSM